jgi:hypothetical protein
VSRSEDAVEAEREHHPVVQAFESKSLAHPTIILIPQRLDLVVVATALLVTPRLAFSQLAPKICRFTDPLGIIQKLGVKADHIDRVRRRGTARVIDPSPPEALTQKKLPDVLNIKSSAWRARDLVVAHFGTSGSRSEAIYREPRAIGAAMSYECGW